MNVRSLLRGLPGRRIVLVIAGVLAIVILSLAVVGLAGSSSERQADQVTGALAGLPQDGHLLGGGNAGVAIVEYVDLLCPACAEQSHQVIPALLGEVAAKEASIERVVIARVSADSRGLAFASYAAAAQDRLWEFTELWLARYRADQSAPTAKRVLEVARDAGLDIPAFTADLSNFEAREADLAAADQRAASDAVTATPTLIIKGPAEQRVIVGSEPLEKVYAAIAEVRPTDAPHQD